MEVGPFKYYTKIKDLRRDSSCVPGVMNINYWLASRSLIVDIKCPFMCNYLNDFGGKRLYVAKKKRQILLIYTT